MKKVLFIIPLAAALILSSCGRQNNRSNDTSAGLTTATDIAAPMAPSANGELPTGGVKQPMQLITIEEAKAIALNYAKVTEAEVSFRDYEQELDDGRYEFEFTANGVEYEVYVAGGTGEVTWFETDKDVGIPNFPTPVTPPDAPSVAPTEPVNPVAPTPAAPPVLTSAKAKSIALNSVGVNESDVRDLDIEFERGVYEINFEHGYKEYEIDINASTGEIIRSNTEFD